MNNKFITIEGTDGAGKSTIISSIKEFLESQGEEVVLTAEPGGTALGKTLREILLRDKMDVLTETLLMFSARNENIKDIINPALKENKYVICDRFTDSTFAYQAYAKGLEVSKVKQLQSLVQDSLRPGLTFILDVPLHVSKQRLAKTNKIPDKFESEKDDFVERVINGYKTIAKLDPIRCRLIDAGGTKESTIEQVLFDLEQYHKKNNPTSDTKRKM